MSQSWASTTLGVIGGGNMAEAIVRGALGARLLPAAAVSVYDPLENRRAVFAELGCRPCASPGDIGKTGAILLAVKPQKFGEAIRDLAAAAASAVATETLLISIVAGVSTQRLETELPPAVHVVRVMPNTPLLVGKGVSAVAGGSRATPADREQAAALFACAGQTFAVDESLMDAVTALSGSGPAYLFRLAEALIAGGVELGFREELSRDLTVGMLRGAAEMLASDPRPALLRERVTSPGGTTAAALSVFEERGFSDLITAALVAARDRGVELGRRA